MDKTPRSILKELSENLWDKNKNDVESIDTALTQLEEYYSVPTLEELEQCIHLYNYGSIFNGISDLEKAIAKGVYNLITKRATSNERS